MADAARQMVKRHPLQRMTSPSRQASALLHVSISERASIYGHMPYSVRYPDADLNQITGLASFAYSFYYLVENPNPMQVHPSSPLLYSFPLLSESSD